MGPITNGDILSFLGAVLGAAVTVWGSVLVINHQAWKRAARDKANLLSFLSMLEARLAFTKSDEALAEFVVGRDVPGLINRCALVLEMADLLNTAAVAEAAEGYRQLYALHKLRRVLRVLSPPFEAYADIPYTDFYKLASPHDFEKAVGELVVPSAIIRGTVHLYITEITGRNVFLEEIYEQNPDRNRTWDPDQVFVPDASSQS